MAMPWWMVAGGLVVALAIGLWVFPKMLPGIPSFAHQHIPSDRRSALAEARVTLHRIVQAPPPADASRYEAEGTLRYIRVDATISPRSNAAGWDPYDLELWPTDAIDDRDDSRAAFVVGLIGHDSDDILEPDSEAREPGDLFGEHRVEVLFGCPPDLAGSAELRYELQSIKPVTLPAATRRAA